MSDAPWEVRVMGPARRQLERLQPAAAAAVLEAFGTIASNPRRLGKPLRFELQDLLSARRGPYRVIYRIEEATHTVVIVAVGHRADIYRPR